MAYRPPSNIGNLVSPVTNLPVRHEVGDGMSYVENPNPVQYEAPPDTRDWRSNIGRQGYGAITAPPAPAAPATPGTTPAAPAAPQEPYPTFTNDYGMGSQNAFSTGSALVQNAYAGNVTSNEAQDTGSRGFNPWSLVGESNVRLGGK